MSELLIPSFVNGAPTFVPYSGDIQRQLREGDPAMGWMGDERLYVAPLWDGRWSIGRVCEDGVKRLVYAGKHGERLDKAVLVKVRDMDTRTHDVLAKITKHNEARKKEIDTSVKEKISENYERVVYEIAKADGHLY